MTSEGQLCAVTVNFRPRLQEIIAWQLSDVTLNKQMADKPITLTALSKAWDYDSCVAGTAGSNPALGMDICAL